MEFGKGRCARLSWTVTREPVESPGDIHHSRREELL